MKVNSLMGRRARTLAMTAVVAGLVGLALRAETAPAKGRDPQARPGSPAAAPPAGLPESVARYYPPRDRKRSYTLAMLDLGRMLGSLSTELRGLHGSAGRAQALDELDRFAAQYEKVGAMVPEWSSYFAPADVKALRDALESGKEGDALEGPLARVGDSCTQCHAAEMFKVQAIFDWPAFADVTGQDRAGETVPFHETMVRLADRLGALPTAVRRADWPMAKTHQQEITVQFALLEDSCGNCHQTPRTYFVDERVKAEVMKLGAMVRRQEADDTSYIEVSNVIYQRSCIPCHQVHMPAAYLQMRLGK